MDIFKWPETREPCCRTNVWQGCEKWDCCHSSLSDLSALFSYQSDSIYKLDIFKHSYHFWDACSRLFADMLPRIAVVAYSISVLGPNLWPCSSYLSTGNAEKSQWVISALQGGYFTGVPPVSADIDVTTCAVCGSAPSWGRTHWFTKHSFFLYSELCSTKQVLVSLHSTSYLQFPFGVPSAEE